jgi:hypothetical protein
LEQEARDAERLHDALGALSRGVPAAVPAAPDLAAMVRAAERLTSAHSAGAGAPRPSFVLGLEEQLRMDLRLGTAPRPERPLGAWRPLLGVALAVFGLGLVFVGVDRAGPGDALHALQGPLNALRASLVFSPAARAAWRLDAGWGYLGEVRTLVAQGRRVPWSLVDAVQGAYADAVRLADASGDDRLVRRVAREAEDAAGVLAALAPLAGPDGPVLEAGGVALEARAGRHVPMPVVGLPAPVASSTAVATAVPTATFAAPPTAAVSPEPVITARPTLTPVPPTPTERAPSATPTPFVAPPTRERPRTATRPPTSAPPSVTPPPVVATPTSDDWPTATAPIPPPAPPTAPPGPSALPPTLP